MEIALRTQQVIAYESGVADVIDPLGGSYAIEQLTDEIEAEAEGYIRKIDALGGAVKAIEEGYPQREIMEAAHDFQRELEAEAEAARDGTSEPGALGRVTVGVNRFVSEETPRMDLVRVDPQVRERQVAKLERVRARRKAPAVGAALDQVQQAAAGQANLLPLIVGAVKAEATLGEIANAMRAVWGEHRERVVI